MTVRSTPLGTGVGEPDAEPSELARGETELRAALGLGERGRSAAAWTSAGGPEVATTSAPVLPPPGGRHALRAARRRRRQLELVCLAVVAALLAVTIAILGMARNRTPTPHGVGLVHGVAASTAGPGRTR